jgi:Domain of unknown function (DUF1906)
MDELSAGPARRCFRMRAFLRFRLRLRLTTVALLALVSAVGGSAASAATSTSSASARRPVLRGGAATRIVRYHGYRLAVPATWPVYDLATDSTQCVRFDRHAVYLGSPSSRQRCPAHAIGRTEAILVSPLLAHGARAGGGMGPALPPVRDPNAQPLRRSATELTVPSAGVVVTATWRSDPSVVQRALGVGSLTAAQARPAAAPRPSARAPHRANDPVYTGLGFDACSTPSSSTMSAWSSSPYRAIGVYIGGANEACSQPNLTPSWVGQESAAGWVLLPIYVGLQAPSNGCGCAAIVPAQAAAEGTAAADDAANQAQAVGIGPGNPLYDDMEGYSRTGGNTSAVLAFLSAWTTELHARGYLSGVYSNANSGISDLVAQVGTGYPEPDEIWIAEWNGQQSTYSPYVPSGDWPNHQRLHQYDGGHDETYGGVTINIDGDYVDAGAAAGGALFPDGTFVQISGSTDFYEIAGGAPLFVSNWSDVGGAQPYVVITAQQFASLNPVPLNGTLLQTNTGSVYRVAGGAPLYVSAPTLFASTKPVMVDQWNIDNVGNPQSHLNAFPSNGTFVTTTSGLSYRIAGGALFGVSSWSVFGRVQPSVKIDPWDVVNVSNPAAHLASTPASGTVVEGLPSAAYWQFANGTRKLTAPAAGAVRVDDRGLHVYPGVPCRVPRLTHLTLAQVKQALLAADCHLGKVHLRPLTRRRHVMRVIKQIPRPRTKHVAYYTVGVTLG